MSFLFLRLNSCTKWLTSAVVEVLAAEVRVARGRLDLEDALLDGEERHVEGAAAEVEDEHVALRRRLLVEAVRDRRRGRLVDDAQHVEAGDRAGVLGRRALRVVEVGGDGDDGVGHVLAEVGLGGLLHLDQHHRRDLLGEELLLLALVLDEDGRAVAVLGDDLEGEVLEVGLRGRVGELAADEALGVEDGVLRVERGLVLGGVADHPLRVGEGDERRGGAVALVVGDDLDAKTPIFHKIRRLRKVDSWPETTERAPTEQTVSKKKHGILYTYLEKLDAERLNELPEPRRESVPLATRISRFLLSFAKTADENFAVFHEPRARRERDQCAGRGDAETRVFSRLLRPHAFVPPARDEAQAARVPAAGCRAVPRARPDAGAVPHRRASGVARRGRGARPRRHRGPSRGGPGGGRGC